MRQYFQHTGAATRCGWLVLSLLSAICPLGCNLSWPGSSAEVDPDEDVFAELADAEADAESGDAAEGVADADSEQAPATAQLNLHVKVGDRFPLQKIVEQTLQQQLGSTSSVGRSRLEVLMGLTVQEVSDQDTHFAVQYQKVHYSQDLGGKRVEYNSSNGTAPSDIPAEARLYAGLVGNGFSFWLGADRQIRDVVGFDQFVQQCLVHVPAAERESVMKQLGSLQGAAGVANFVDDSIGLLPAGAGGEVHVGSRWSLRPQQIEGPVPMQVTTNCILKELTERTAEINLVGTIPPTEVEDYSRGLTVTVSGGRCLGTCIVDRATGLPTSSRVERQMDMLVVLSDGTRIPQHKSTVTTVNAFLGSSAAMNVSHHDGGPARTLQPTDQPALSLGDPSQPSTASRQPYSPRQPMAPRAQMAAGLNSSRAAVSYGEESGSYETGSIQPASAEAWATEEAMAPPLGSGATQTPRARQPRAGGGVEHARWDTNE